MDTLTAMGRLNIKDPGATLECANAVGLDPRYAAVCLAKESFGGQNLWGSDHVFHHDSYQFGAVVTQDAYMTYKNHRAEWGAQGVGPCQLTSFDLQDAADAQGGCWRWDVNCKVGFAHLSRLINNYGAWGGFRRYNGAGSAAVGYANDAMLLLHQFELLLGSTPASLHFGDKSLLIDRLHKWLNTRYPLYSNIPASQYYGPETKAVIAEFQKRSGITGSDADGSIVGPKTWAALMAAGFVP